MFCVLLEVALDVEIKNITTFACVVYSDGGAMDELEEETYLLNIYLFISIL